MVRVLLAKVQSRELAQRARPPETRSGRERKEERGSSSGPRMTEGRAGPRRRKDRRESFLEGRAIGLFFDHGPKAKGEKLFRGLFVSRSLPGPNREPGPDR